MTRKPSWAAGLVVGLAASIAGCGAQQTERSGHAQPVATASSPSAVPTATRPSPFSSGTPTGTSSSSAIRLPAGCEEVLTPDDVDRIVGRPLGGSTEYIQGVAEPRIARTGRVTCRYGVRAGPTGGAAEGGDAAAPVELGLSTYADPESASQRVDFTVHEQQVRGATQTQVTVLDKPAILLTGGRTDPLLVMSDGTMTLALSMRRTLLPADAARQALLRITEVVLRHLR